MGGVSHKMPEFFDGQLSVIGRSWMSSFFLIRCLATKISNASPVKIDSNESPKDKTLTHTDNCPSFRVSILPATNNMANAIIDFSSRT